MNKTLRYVIYAALFVIPFLALYVDGSMFFPFISGKNFAFRILVEIATAAWVLLALSDRKYRPRFSWPLVLYGALTVWMFIADLLAVNAHKAFWSNFERMDGWVTLVHLFLFLLVAGSVFAADNLWRRWWLTFLSAQFLVVCYGFFQLFGWAAIHQGSTRVDASLGNAEYLAGYLLFGIAVALWLALETAAKEQRWLRISLFVLAVLETVILFATGTRGTAIGFVSAIVIGGFLWLLGSGKQGRRGALIALAVLVLAVGGFTAIRNAPFIAHNPVLSRYATIALSDLTPRFMIWGMAAKGIEAKPVHGWGQEGFNYVFNTYYNPKLYGQEPWFDRAHNIYLDWAVAGGIPALLLFLALLASTVWALYRGTASRVERVMLLSALAAYAIQGLVVFDNLFTYVPFVAFLGLAHAARSRPFASLEKAPEISAASLTTAALPAVAVILAGTLWFVNVPGILMGKDLIQAVTPTLDVGTRYGLFQKAMADGGFATQEVREQLVQFAASVAQASNVPTDVKSTVAGYTVAQMQQELTRAPKDARLHIEFAMLFRSLGDLADAQKESALARQLSPTKESIITEQGIEALQAGNAQQASAFFQQAYALDPASDDLAAYAAAGHILTGDTPGAKSLLLERFGTTTPPSQNILELAYFQKKDWTDLIALLTATAEQQNDVNSWLQVAAVDMQAGRKADAQAVVNQLLKTHPEAASQASAILQMQPTAQ